MKTCPICKATCFDDMEVCYGCMHRFGTEPALTIPAIEKHSPERQPNITPEEPRGRHCVRPSKGPAEHGSSSAMVNGAYDKQARCGTNMVQEDGRHPVALLQHSELPGWIPLAVLGGGQDDIALPIGQNKNGTAMQYRLVLGLQSVQV